MNRSLIIGLMFAGSLLVGTLAASSVYAQDADRAKKREMTREELVQKIEQVKYQKLKPALALDDVSGRKFFALYKPAEKDIQGLVLARNEAMKKLALATQNEKSGNNPEPEMEKVRDLNKRIESREQSLDNDLKPMLTAQQRAKL